MAYLKLFHGRASPDEQIDSWGEDGPIFGPYPFFHTVYDQEITFDAEQAHCLQIVSDMVYYNDMYYGDWSVFDGPVDEEDEPRLTQFEAPLALRPELAARPVTEDGNVNPNVLWSDVISAVDGKLSNSVAALSTAMLEWLDVGGSPPWMSIHVGRSVWTPRKSVSAGIVRAACQALRSHARNDTSVTTSESEPSPLPWYTPGPNEDY